MADWFPPPGEARPPPGAELACDGRDPPRGERALAGSGLGKPPGPATSRRPWSCSRRAVLAARLPPAGGWPPRRGRRAGPARAGPGRPSGTWLSRGCLPRSRAG